jgi:pyruvate dehydrogenase E1 component beta subunit
MTGTLSGSTVQGTRTVKYREALNEALREEMRRDPSVFLMGEGIAERGGSFRVTEGLLAEFGPWRVLDTPISEASFTGAGVGAAIVGMRPVVEVLFVDFLLLAMDQLVNQAAKFRFFTCDRRGLPLVVRTQGGAGNGLAAQHSQSLEALFYHIPGLQLATPSTPHDAKGLLKSAIRGDDPVIFLEHKLLYQTEGPLPTTEHLVPFGVGEVKRAGADVTLIAWSNMVPRSLAAAEQVAQEGVSVEVVDPRTLVPLDTELILKSVGKTRRALVVQEAVRRGGVASDIVSIIMENAFGALEAPVRIVAGKNTPIPFSIPLERAAVPQVEDIAAAVRALVREERTGGTRASTP